MNENSVPTNQVTRSPNPEHCNFETLILCIPHGLYHCLLQTKHIHVLGDKCTLFFPLILGTDQKYVGDDIM